MNTGGHSARSGLIGRGVGLVRGHPKVSGLIAFLAAGLLVFGILWFEPQKLLQEKTVNEAFPSTPQTPPANASSPIRTAAVAQGPFRSLEHKTTGTASVVRLADGSHILRFEDLDTSNGPDLRVYLSKVEASNNWRAYGGSGTYLELGELKGNRGDQNYKIPTGTDLAQFRSAVIWCVRFRVGFGVAPLNAA
jgi:electron transfer DM13